jgi:hypothetical protein
MASSGMLRRVAFVLTRATQRNIPENAILKKDLSLNYNQKLGWICFLIKSQF